jgi:hypothetical protein
MHIARIRKTIEAILFQESQNFLCARIICDSGGFNSIAATNTKIPNNIALG